MTGKLLTLEGYEHNDFLGWSVPKIKFPSIHIPKPTINIDAIKAETQKAIEAAKQKAAEQVEIAKANLKEELEQSKKILADRAQLEIDEVKNFLKQTVKEKYVLAKELKLNQLSTNLYKDLTGQTLSDYISSRTDKLSDDILQLEKDFLVKRYDEIKTKVKTDLKQELTDLYIKTYLKVTGQEMPPEQILDIEKMQLEAVEVVNKILNNPRFVEKIILKLSSKIVCPEKTKKYIIDFLNICVPDFMNIGEQIPKILEQFDPASVYFLLESINYISIILESKGQYIFENRNNDLSSIINYIVDNTPYIPGENPYKDLEQKNIIPAADMLVKTSAPGTIPASENKKNKNILLIAGIIGTAAITKILKLW